ncbi:MULTISPECIES: tRNA adenosine(34) deaminase TadA [Trueperella]|uniref:tRNA-specific adenosine deaminase n=1 Tax=Trueperella abortisuis TaxID=445930 RepID=A0ABT9PMU6_9ACTO|nr:MULTISPECIES: tRNA adenosine(34) deaminase TadA [Trueperella]MCI7305815.1 tRNA adenosine(34) deaminase TadA [Trueperella sp.]MDP9833460.1 tRNA(adenine34) deaminase [Trueperella abortisuis]
MEESWIDLVLELARGAGDAGDVPVAAVVVDEAGREIGRGINTREIDHDPAGHAEINALRQAGRARGSWNLSGATMYVTLEPCTMCAGAIVNARISRVVFAAWDEKAGAAGSVRDVLRDSRLNHEVEVRGGVAEERAARQLREWFAARRG